ncbi:glycosyltransferase family 4 protein [Flavobacterium sp. F372]|uniref:Glycosyltransferase n=1 Tax=Flavobacterium bernardetii TaxID=2813823 RepID=A0ABR7IVK5_9FLAO|nr:glycosyltransferase [Flavobacterium bernardetii]MBC5833537.1 glycosyltransferase [Flavobacterium bernardetii]NHF68769.1 glycosyltransferase family 4 protein [Flavobacterium bernardetii]
MQKKNIAIICSWLDIPKGVGSFFVEQAELVKDNFHVHLVYFKPYKFGFSKRKKASFSIKTNTYFTENKIPVFEVNYPEIYFFRKFLFQKAIEKKAQKSFLKKIDKPINLCHAQSLFDAGFWCYKLNKNFNIPYIFTEHNQLNLKGLPRKKDKLLQKVIANASEKLVVSDDLIRQFASNGLFFDFNKLGNTFDEKCFSYSKKTEDYSFKIITVGAYTPIKNYENLLEALTIVDKNIFSEIQFTWIGCDCWGGDNEQIVSQLTKSLGLKNIKIDIIKLATKYEVANELKTSTVFISTSLCETFGVSVLEALACGVPVISTNSGGVLEMITPENGIICPIKNPEEIAENILKIYNKKLVFDTEKNSEDIKLKFGSTTFIKKISTIYTRNID